MAEVTVTINGRNYGIACDNGQEQRVMELGNYINERLSSIAAGGAATTESHLLVLTSLVLADEIQELRDSVGIPAQNQQSQEEIAIAQEEQQALGNAVEHLNQRVIQIANRLKDVA